MLPYNGQMIWDAVFYDRSLTMKTLFNKPKDVNYFLDTYGCYLMHCGALRNGIPGEHDNHALHGEMPYAKYDKASIVMGKNEKGKFVGLTGIFEYNRSFGDKYQAIPTVKLYENSSILDIDIEINNMTGNLMELMYLCHINNYGVNGGRIVQSCGWTPDDMQVRKLIPYHNRLKEGFLDFLNEVEKNPSITRVISDEIQYDPEISILMFNFKTDSKGFAYAMQVHPDGCGDLVKFKPTELKIPHRWHCTSSVDGQNKLGLALPATCGSEGYTIEKSKGHIEHIKPFGKFSASMEAGYVTKKQAKEVEDLINSL